MEVESSFCDLNGGYKEGSLSQRRKPVTFLSLVAFVLQAVWSKYYNHPSPLSAFQGKRQVHQSFLASSLKGTTLIFVDAAKKQLHFVLEGSLVVAQNVTIPFQLGRFPP